MLFIYAVSTNTSVLVIKRLQIKLFLIGASCMNKSCVSSCEHHFSHSEKREDNSLLHESYWNRQKQAESSLLHQSYWKWTQTQCNGGSDDCKVVLKIWCWGGLWCPHWYAPPHQMRKWLGDEGDVMNLLSLESAWWTKIFDSFFCSHYPVTVRP